MKRFVVISALFIVFAGCGSDEPTLSQGETEQALGAVNAAASLGVITANAELSSGSASLSVTGSCPGGGNLAISGSITTGAAGASYELDLTFDACVFNGTQMDGALSYAGSMADNSGTFSASGELTFSGNIQGTCSIDISSERSPTGFSVSGSACGNNVSIQIGAQQ